MDSLMKNMFGFDLGGEEEEVPYILQRGIDNAWYKIRNHKELTDQDKQMLKYDSEIKAKKIIDLMQFGGMKIAGPNLAKMSKLSKLFKMISPDITEQLIQYDATREKE